MHFVPFYKTFLKGIATSILLVIFLNIFSTPSWISAILWLALCIYMGVFQTGRVVVLHSLSVFFSLIGAVLANGKFRQALVLVITIVSITAVRVQVREWKAEQARSERAIIDPAARERLTANLRKAIPGITGHRIFQILGGNELTRDEEILIDAFLEQSHPVKSASVTKSET